MASRRAAWGMASATRSDEASRISRFTPQLSCDQPITAPGSRRCRVATPLAKRDAITTERAAPCSRKKVWGGACSRRLIGWPKAKRNSCPSAARALSRGSGWSARKGKERSRSKI